MTAQGERIKRLCERLQDPRYRHAYFESHMDSSIAAQIAANREARGMTQEQLAKEAGMFQSQVSKMEDVNYDGWKAKTLRKIVDFRPGASVDLRTLPGGAYIVAVPELEGWAVLYNIPDAVRAGQMAKVDVRSLRVTYGAESHGLSAG